jgi:hypothetical protein
MSPKIRPSFCFAIAAEDGWGGVSGNIVLVMSYQRHYHHRGFAGLQVRPAHRRHPEFRRCLEGCHTQPVPAARAALPDVHMLLGPW